MADSSVGQSHMPCSSISNNTNRVVGMAVVQQKLVTSAIAWHARTNIIRARANRIVHTGNTKCVHMSDVLNVIRLRRPTTQRTRTPHVYTDDSINPMMVKAEIGYTETSRFSEVMFRSARSALAVTCRGSAVNCLDKLKWIGIGISTYVVLSQYNPPLHLPRTMANCKHVCWLLAHHPFIASVQHWLVVTLAEILV